MPAALPAIGGFLASPAGIGTIATLGGTAYAANRSNQATQAAANNQIDPAQIAADSIGLQLDYAPQILANEQSLRPQYAQLNQSILNNTLFGSGPTLDTQSYFNNLDPASRAQVQAEAERQGLDVNTWLGRHLSTQAANGEQWSTQAVQNYTRQDPNSFLGMLQQAVPALSNLQATANTAQRQADIADVENLGGRATAAYRSANPQLAGATDALGQRIDAARGQGGAAGLTNAAGSSLLPGYESYASDLDRLSPIQQELQQQALAELATGGRLSPEATRDAEQAVRAAASDRGMAFANSTIFNEALNKEQLTRQRQAENRSLALTVDQAGQQQRESNRNFGLNVAGQGNQLSMFNTGEANDLSQFNAELARAYQNDSFGRDLAYTQLLQSQAQDPYALITGRSAAPAQAQGVMGQAGYTLDAGPTLTTLFDPTVTSAYGANYNASQAANLSSANNYGALAGAGLGLFGDLLGGLFGNTGDG